MKDIYDENGNVIGWTRMDEFVPSPTVMCTRCKQAVTREEVNNKIECKRCAPMTTRTWYEIKAEWD